MIIADFKSGRARVSPALELIISYFTLFTHELTIWKLMYHNIKEVQMTFYFVHHLFMRY